MGKLGEESRCMLAEQLEVLPRSYHETLQRQQVPVEGVLQASHCCGLFCKCFNAAANAATRPVGYPAGFAPPAVYKIDTLVPAAVLSLQLV